MEKIKNKNSREKARRERKLKKLYGPTSRRERYGTEKDTACFYLTRTNSKARTRGCRGAKIMRNSTLLHGAPRDLA